VASGGSAIRGSRVGAGPMGEQDRGITADRVAVSYWDELGNETVRYFAAGLPDEEIPDVIDSPSSGLPAGRDRDNPPVLAKQEPYKTHLAYVKERRTDAEAEQLLDDPGPRWGQVSNEFHSMVGGLTGNPVLDLVGSSLNDIHADRVRPIFPVGSRAGVLRVHKKIADAIISGDADQAEHLSRRHIQELIKRLKELNPNMLDELIDWH